MREGGGGVHGALQKSSANRVCDLFGTTSVSVLPHSQHVQMRWASCRSGRGMLRRRVRCMVVFFLKNSRVCFDGSIQLVSSNIG
jgi:hypothetical protein